MAAITCLCAACLLAALSFSVALKVERATRAPYRQILENQNDMTYHGNMTVGGQQLQCVPDTGSVEFVVVSDKCNNLCGAASKLFHADSSSSYTKGPLSVILSYGSGEVVAREAYDAVTVGPLGSAGAPFWEVLDSSMPLLLSAKFEAIVGLGPIAPEMNTMEPGGDNNEDSFALLLKKLNIRRFSVCLGREPNSQGYLTWNDDYVEQTPQLFSKISVADNGFWMTTLSDVRLGTTPLACYGTSTCGAVLDSGTSLVSMPESAHDAMGDILEKLNVDCAHIGELPDLHFKLDGVHHSLPPDSYVAQVHSESQKAVSKHFNSNNANTSSCQSAIMHLSMTSSLGPTWVLGMPFFRKYYSVFVQASATSPSAIYTALANEHCLPARVSSQALARGARRSMVSARVIDASQVRMPLWLHRAVTSGYWLTGSGRGLISDAAGDVHSMIHAGNRTQGLTGRGRGLISDAAGDVHSMIHAGNRSQGGIKVDW